jgi:outer membrane protein assembly factor BamD (BamD/ComL family)
MRSLLAARAGPDAHVVHGRRMMHRRFLVAILAAVAAASGCASLKLPSPAPSASAQPGTPAWWKKHKKTAEMVPGKGYRVDGVDGFYDANGVPINSRVAKVVDKKDQAGGLLNDAGAKEFVGGVKESLGMGPDEKESRRQYELGEANFRGKHYDDAADNFAAAAKGWPNSALEQDALFRKAESEFFADRYPKANNTYEKLLKEYPNSPYLDHAITRQFAIARYWEQYADYNPNWVTTPNVVNKRLPLFDTIGRSIKVYENIRLNDPTGPLADDSIMATANSYFRRGRWNDADYQYDLLRKEYPRSDHVAVAFELGLQAKKRRYQGADYDGTVLEEAQQLVKQQRRQFARELTEEQVKRLANDEAWIRSELAARELAMAQHFDGIDQYGSAKFYYGQVVKNYPSTPIAEQARTRLAEMGDLPDQPESKLSWVLDMVPESSERLQVKQVPLLENNNLGPPGANTPMLATPPAQGTPGDSTIVR